jgi:hypothetical protein
MPVLMAGMMDPTLYRADIEAEARLLLLIRAFTRPGRTLQGRTKLAKSDFLLRYPEFFRRALAARGRPVSDEPEPDENNIERRMVRYRYGPWDPAYYALLGSLLARGLHGRPYFVNRFGDRIPAMNVELWGGSNGPIYEERSVRLWNAYYFDTSLLALLLVGLAEPRLVKLAKPQDIPYSVFLERLLSFHLYPLPLARTIAQHLVGK